MREGVNNMMDIMMLGILIIGFISLKLFADWCGKQIEAKKQNGGK